MGVNESPLFTQFSALQETLSFAKEQIANGDPTLTLNPRRLIWQKDFVDLYAYPCQAATATVLIVFAPINRAAILDFSRQASWLQEFNAQNLQVLLLDWSAPTVASAPLTWQQYVTEYLHPAVQYVQQYTQLSQVNLLGICQGGVLSLCYALAFPENIARLMTVATPFSGNSSRNRLAYWLGDLDLTPLLKHPLIPGSWLGQQLASVKPYHYLATQLRYFCKAAQQPEKMSQILQLHHWLWTMPDQLSSMLIPFVQDFLINDRLLRGNLRLNQHPLQLARLTCPLLNVMAEYDAIAPPECLTKKVAIPEYSSYTLETGHLGLFTKPSIIKELSHVIRMWLQQGANANGSKSADPQTESYGRRATTVDDHAVDDAGSS